MRKFIVHVLIASLLIGLMASVSFAETSEFSDIDKSYAKDAILELQSKGIINGMDNSHFNPKGTLTRAEFVTIMVRSLGLDTSATTSSFSDVSGWAIPYVEAAYKAGIISGTGGGKFSPNTATTREMSIVILVRSLQTKGELDENATLNFTDANKISDWAKPFIAIAQKYGLVTGNPDGSFNPKGEANREMAAIMGSNLLVAIVIVANVEPTPEPTPEPDPTPTPIPEPTPTPDPTPPYNGGGGYTPPTVAVLTAYNTALAAVVEADYTITSWDTYQLVVADNVVTVTNTQAQVNAATAAITLAQGSLVTVAAADQAAADAAVVTAEGSNLQTDVDAAQLLVTALQADVAPATTKSDLQGRIDAVQSVIDIATALANAKSAADVELAKVVAAQSAYTTAGGLTTDAVYTDVTTAKDAVDAAVTTNVTADILSTTTTLTTKLGDLTTAKDALDASADANLASAIVAASALTSTDYADYSAVTLALGMAEITNAEKIAKTTTINDAITALVFAGKADLDTAKGNATALAETNYTALSWADLTTALALPETTNAEVVTKTSAINNAILNLVTVVATVSNLAELTAALADTNITTINITADITAIGSPVVVAVGHAVTINGGGNTLTFTGLEGATLDIDDGLIIQAPTTINNLIVDAGLITPTAWVGTYAIHVYNTTATLNNVTVTGGNGGILVNGSTVTLTGTIDVAGNGFGGIESSGASASLDVSVATLTNGSEAYGLPTIWEDGITGTTVTGFVGTSTIVSGQTLYYMTATNTTLPVITLIGNATENVANGSPYADAGATATDDIDGDITANIVTTITNDANAGTTFDSLVAATYTYHYNVSDIAGNAAIEVTRIVVVAP